MYKKKKKKFAFWTVTQSLGEKREKKNLEGDKKDYKSYCLLLLERGWTSIPKFVVVWTFSLLRFFFFLCRFYGQL